MPRHLKLLILPVALLALAACNTVEGAGKDIQAGGHAVSNAAKKTSDAISD